jgi:curved DNA-binding protein CbpA
MAGPEPLGLAIQEAGLQLAEVFLEGLRNRASGYLEVEHAEGRRSFGLLRGQLVSAEGGALDETLVGRLQATEQISQAQADAVQRFAREQRVSELSALMSLRLMEARQLVTGVQSQIQYTTERCLSLPAPRVRFVTSPVPHDSAATFSCRVAPLVHGFLTKGERAPTLHGLLLESERAVGRASDTLRALTATLLTDRVSGTRLICAINAHQTLSEITSFFDGDAPLLAALWIADRLGALSRPDPSKRPPRSAPAVDLALELTQEGPPATSKNPRPGARPTEALQAALPVAAEAEALRSRIAEMHDQLGTSTYYELLGVEADSSTDQIRQGYFQTAKQVHPDKLARLGLGALRAKASEVFAAIAQAYQVLSGDTSRRQYDEQRAPSAAVAREPAWDGARIAGAEAAFQKGELLMRMGNFRGATELLGSSVGLWSAEASYHAALGWSRFRQTPSDPKGAQEALRSALALDPDHAQAHWWLSLVLQDESQPEEASRHATQARHLDPQVGRARSGV